MKYPLLKEQVVATDSLLGEFKDDDSETKQRFNHWNMLFDFTKREDGVLNYTL